MAIFYVDSGSFGTATITTLNVTTLSASFTSLQNITASNLDLGTNYISVNVTEPQERFGGIYVYDSGSSAATASLSWDSLHNHWVYQNASGSTYSGGMLLSGPRNFGALGDEPNLVTNFIVKSQGGDHITTSSLFDNGTYVSINSNTQVSGALDISGSITLNGTAVTAGGGGSFASRFIIHSGEGSTTAITTGIKYTTAVIADKASTITGWKIFCNPSSSISLEVLKANKSQPNSGNSIIGSAAPSITANQYNESTTLTGWTTSVLEGDILILNVVSNTAATYIQLELTQQ